MVQALRMVIATALDVVFALRKFQLRAEVARVQESRTPIDNLKISENDVDTQYRGALILILRSFLRRFPYWAQGHMALAEVAFKQRDYPLSFSSSIALEKLGVTQKQKDRARLIRARCLIATRACEQAEKILRELRCSVWVSRTEVNEELGATLIALGRENEARAALEEIPVDSRSQTCQSALEYLCREK